MSAACFRSGRASSAAFSVVDEDRLEIRPGLPGDRVQALADVRTDNARLREEARRLQEDPSAIEDLARRELGLIKPGEKLFILKDVPPTDSGRPK